MSIAAQFVHSVCFSLSGPFRFDFVSFPFLTFSHALLAVSFVTASFLVFSAAFMFYAALLPFSLSTAVPFSNFPVLVVDSFALSCLWPAFFSFFVAPHLGKNGNSCSSKLSYTKGANISPVTPPKVAPATVAPRASGRVTTTPPTPTADEVHDRNVSLLMLS